MRLLSLLITQKHQRDDQRYARQYRDQKARDHVSQQDCVLVRVIELGLMVWLRKTGLFRRCRQRCDPAEPEMPELPQPAVEREAERVAGAAAREINSNGACFEGFLARDILTISVEVCAAGQAEGFHTDDSIDGY